MITCLMDLAFKIQKNNIGTITCILKIPSVPSFKQNDKFDFFGSNFPKKEFKVGNSSHSCWNKNQHSRDITCANFQLKQTTLTFLVQICPKRKVGFEIQKINVRITISILEIPYVPIFRQNQQVWIFGSNLLKNGFWGRNFKNLCLDLESASLRYYVH